MPEYEVDVGNAWSVAYGAPHSDPHGVFATLLGVERSEAKRICYEYMWSEEGRKVFVIQQWHHTSQEGVFIYKFFADIMKTAGLEIAVPELQEIFNMMED